MLKYYVEENNQIVETDELPEEDSWIALTDPNDDEPDQIYLVDASNESTATSVWTASPLSAPSDRRMPYCDPETRLYGYLDLNGNIAIEARFAFAGDFWGGVAHVVENGKHGLIDASGEWLVPAEYDYIALGDGFILALKGNSLCAVYAPDGKSELFRIEESGVAAAAVGDAIGHVLDDGLVGLPVVIDRGESHESAHVVGSPVHVTML